MYTQTFLVTSVRGRVFAPQTAASASLSFFGAKMPLPAFFMANAFFLPVALWAFFPIVRFSALIVFNVAFGGCRAGGAPWQNSAYTRAGGAPWQNSA